MVISQYSLKTCRALHISKFGHIIRQTNKIYVEFDSCLVKWLYDSINNQWLVRIIKIKSLMVIS